MKRKTIILTLLIAFLLPCITDAQTVIPVCKEADGKYSVEASLNGVRVRTYYAEENWFASVSSTTYLFLTENGYIANADVKGMTTLKMPGGSTTKAGSFVIRSLRMGNVIVKDLPAFVIAKQNVPLIIGSSAFDCFGEVTLMDDRLIINDADELIEPEPELSLSRTDSLRLAIQTHMDAKEYPEARKAFEELAAVEELSMFNEYRYICLLNILKDDKAAIMHSEKWLSAYGGKAQNLDFWVYDALGDAYSNLGKAAEAVESYEAAVQTYYAMFETNEKNIRRGGRKDETLGYTLYALGRQYANMKNLKKAEQCCSLAAICGNSAAMEFCKKYGIR